MKVCVFLFDILYLNGESFIQKPLAERRDALRANFHVLENKFIPVKSIDTNTMEEVEEFLEESIKGKSLLVSSKITKLVSNLNIYKCR